MTETKKKKNVALVFGITKDYTFALANVLIGLKRHNQKFWDDIIVYHDGVSDYEQKSINEIMAVKFVDLSESEHFQKIAESNIETMEKYSIAAFYRYECLNLLDEYHQVIWNDVDILIRQDISALTEFGKKSGVAFSIALSDFVVGSAFRKFNDDYEMFRPLWNDGIMVLTDSFAEYKEAYKWCIKTTLEYEDMLMWPDLAVLNMMLQEFKIEPENIELNKYVCLPTAEGAENAAIIHAYGDRKFWNDLEYMEKNPEWSENAIEWSKILYKNAKEKSPMVSCIMSCYERYDYLVEAVKTVLMQSYANFELIVVLEKSKAQRQIEKVLKGINDPRIVIINNKEKLGFAASLNVGIEAAKGDYIARMDDDDLTTPCRFAKQVKYMEEHPKVGVVGGNMEVFGVNDGEFLTFKDADFIKANTLFATPFLHPTVMLKKRIMDEKGLRYDPNYFTEDYELWSRAVYVCETANLPEILTFYRSHANQSTAINDIKVHESHKRVMRNQLKKYLKLDLTENEIETVQIRKDCISKVEDIDGAFALRMRTIDKIIKANRIHKVYNEDALKYVINWGKPNRFGGKGMEIVEENKLKKRLKSMIKPLINPIYGRAIGKVETMMMNHDEELRLELQKQIDDINEEGRKN